MDALLTDARQRAGEDDLVSLHFFGGPPPPIDWVTRVDVPVSVRVRPDLLSRKTASDLIDAGVQRIELDALSLNDDRLRGVGRRYGGALVREMCAGLRERGVEVGIVLAPGLPGSSFEASVEEARAVVPLVDTVRIHPVLVLQGSRLEEAHYAGMYEPLDLGQAVTVCRAMMDVLESGGARVLRVGLQPGPDGLGRVSAGPHHASLRELVEARRSLDVLEGLLDGVPPGCRVTIRCAPADQTRTRGPLNQNLRTLRAEYRLASIRLSVDPGLLRGRWRIERDET